MHTLAFLVFLFLQPTAHRAVEPPVPFYDWGACPSEGCTYRRWQAVKPLTVWTSRDHRHVAFTIKPKEWTRGITGVVLTVRPGITRF